MNKNGPPSFSESLVSPEKPLNPLTDSVVSAVWIVPGVAILVFVISLSLGTVHLSHAGRHFFSALIYSASIGIPSIVLLNWIGLRFTGSHPRLVVVFELLALALTATFGCFVAGILFQVAKILPRNEFWIEFRTSYPFALVISIAVGFGITLFETMRHKLQDATIQLRTRQVEQERANKLLAEARLSSLESRLHPHFLFNTLNSIAALIPTDPARAEATVGKLASLLRFSLSAQHASLVTLEQELKIVRDYLEIESTRFGPRLRFEITIPAELGDLKVPPLALQSLVENSVKHVAAQRSEGASIWIGGARENGRLQLEVIDDGPGFSLASVSPEHGLGNLSARLQLLFDDAGQLDVKRENEKTIARISFPAKG
jgi:two-component system, LytTR family, sensor histidine kinase AlgZ